MAAAIFAGDLQRAALPAIPASSPSSLSLFPSPPLSFSLSLSCSLSPQHTIIRRSLSSCRSNTPRAVQHYLEEAETSCLSSSKTKTPAFVRSTMCGKAVKAYVDPPHPVSFGGHSWFHEVPIDPTIVMVSLVCDESHRISKHVFRDKLSKL